MGTARAPVVGSGDAPAWTCLVSKPQLSDMVLTPVVVGGTDPTTTIPTHQPGFRAPPAQHRGGATESTQGRWLTSLRGAGRGTPRRPLRARGPAGFGRHGRRVPRPRPPPGAGRRGQGA